MSALSEPSVNASAEVAREGSRLRFAPQGEWTVGELRRREEEIARLALDGVAEAEIDLSGVTRLDTAGAWAVLGILERWRAAGIDARLGRVAPSQRIILDEVGKRRGAAPGPHRRRRPGIADLLAGIGAAAAGMGRDAVEVTGFLGRVVAGLGTLVLRPWRFRGVSVVHQLDRTGFRAVAIVALISFLVGGIVAQQGAFQLQRFGATLFVVDMVGILVLREVGMLLAAIMLAGRSGSAFTAEIGAMKMREEIDALRVFGLDPVEVLAIPRLLALVLALPLLTVVADMAALLGAGLMAWAYAGISPEAFVFRLRNAVDLDMFWVGLIKAPFMGLMIGLIACVEGLRVDGSAESLGRQTTASVVKSIFMVIVLDGIFAIFFSAIRF